MARQAAPLVVLIGLPGVGKTEIRRRLERLLEMASIGPDDNQDRWASVYPVVNSGAAILECCKLPGRIRRMLSNRPATVIELVADTETRRSRLQAQGLDEQTVAERLVEEPLHYPDQPPAKIDLTLETTESPAELAARIADRVGRGGS
jgi:hypothetical protein